MLSVPGFDRYLRLIQSDHRVLNVKILEVGQRLLTLKVVEVTAGKNRVNILPHHRVLDQSLDLRLKYLIQLNLFLDLRVVAIGFISELLGLLFGYFEDVRKVD